MKIGTGNLHVMMLGSCECSKRHALFKGANEILSYFLYVLPMQIKSDGDDGSNTYQVIWSLTKICMAKTILYLRE
jgi:hypothetical protein